MIGWLPGSDPALANQVIVLTAHIDGYGIGEPWKGDSIYNGAFDDAAYVATLIDFAEMLRASGTRLRRSLLFAVVTGEEKGLSARAITRRTDRATRTTGRRRQSRSAPSGLSAAHADDACVGRVDARRHGEGGGGDDGDPHPGRP